MLGPGDPAPDFDLPRPADGEVYRLSAAASAGPVVLAVYPLADADAAAALLRALANADWGGAGALTAFGIGVGDPAAHEALAAAVDVPVALLVDQDGYVADCYGVPARPDGRPARALFLVDRDCRVRAARRVADADEAVAALADAARSL